MPRSPVTPEKAARGKRLRELREHFGTTQEAFLGADKRVQVVGAESGRNNLTGPLALAYARRVGVEPEAITAYFSGDLPLADLLAGAANPVSSAQVRHAEKVETLTRLLNPPDLSTRAAVAIALRAAGVETTLASEIAMSVRFDGLEQLEDGLKTMLAIAGGKVGRAPMAEHDPDNPPLRKFKAKR